MEGAAVRSRSAAPLVLSSDNINLLRPWFLRLDRLCASGRAFRASVSASMRAGGIRARCSLAVDSRRSASRIAMDGPSRAAASRLRLDERCALSWRAGDVTLVELPWLPRHAAKSASLSGLGPASGLTLKVARAAGRSCRRRSSRAMAGAAGRMAIAQSVFVDAARRLSPALRPCPRGERLVARFRAPLAAPTFLGALRQDGLVAPRRSTGRATARSPRLGRALSRSRGQVRRLVMRTIFRHKVEGVNCSSWHLI